MAKSVPAIFLDRDGTINVDHGYVHEIDNFEFIDGVIDAMRELKKMGFALVVVTNQSGIARGKFTEVNANAVECSIRITSLLYAGNAIRSAEGKIMQRYILKVEKP